MFLVERHLHKIAAPVIHFRTGCPSASYFFNLSFFTTLSIAFFISLLPIAAFAQPLATAPNETVFAKSTEALKLESQRFHYQRAKEALTKNNSSDYAKHYQHLQDYPLKQYLDYAEIRSNLAKVTLKKLDSFFNEYPDTFLSSRLRYNALIFFASRKRWDDFVAIDNSEYSNTRMRCLRTYAQYISGNEAILEQTAELWNVGRSQPDACDALFKLWKNKGGLTQEVLWSRFNKAMSASRRSLAGYIARSMNDENLRYVDLFRQVDRRPHLITKADLFREQRTEIQDIIIYGIRKLARKDPQRAMRHWELYEAQQLFPEYTQRDIKIHIVRHLTRNGYGEDAQRLLSYSHSLRDTKVVEEIIRDGLSELDWIRVISGIDLLPEKEQQRDRWVYWRTRALAELRLAQDPTSIKKSYNELAQNRSFYGFLAADRLGTSYSLEDASHAVSQLQLDYVASIGGMKRAYELWLMGSTVEAKAEWLHTSKDFSTDELIIAGQLAKQWGWYNGGIQAMITGNLWNQLSVRFPLAYKEEVNRVAKDTQLDPTLIYAIARQESAFDEGARSSAGALGLMQLLPSTARQTAQKSGVKFRKQDLFKAENNMRIGSQYLSELLGKYNGNRILAAAAYNAGPHRVKRWLSDNSQAVPFDVWIETIPFRETRHYVQNVLAYSVIYGYRLGITKNLVTEQEAKARL